MPTFLSWNVYDGTINGSTPAQRIAQILALANQNTVDVVCLQEVPQSLLDATIAGGFGVPGVNSPIVVSLNAAMAGWNNAYYALQAYSETNPTGAAAATTTDGYLIFYRAATMQQGYAGLGYYNAAAFILPTGAYLRPPATVNLTFANGQPVTVMNWHADQAAVWAMEALGRLNQLLGHASTQPHLTVVMGDFNYGPVNNLILGQQAFPGWTDWSTVIQDANGTTIANGLDHILTSAPSVNWLTGQLGFTSDSYHFPICIKI
jgi:endonuclease/exonuclease/phosphatase family metal-dependent hydrolase